MPNYKESTIPFTSYVRAYHAVAVNPLQGPKFIQFREEVVIVLPDGTSSTTPAGDCAKFLTAENATESFPMLADDGTPTGTTATYAQVYRILMSLYWHIATERDAGNV